MFSIVALSWHVCDCSGCLTGSLLIMYMSFRRRAALQSAYKTGCFTFLAVWLYLPQ